MKILIAIITFLISIIAFIPQNNILFSVQKILKKENIYLQSTNISESLFSLKLKNNIIIYNNIKIAKIDTISTLFTLVYNDLDIKNIKINFDNLQITNLYLNNNIIKPWVINIKGIANFAKINGYINLKTRKIFITFLNLQNNDIKIFLHHNKKGYFYEKNF